MSTDPSTPENDANLSALGRELLDTGGSKPSGPWVPPTAEELHKLLPEYEIVKMLGRGGMGAVYMGKQISLDRPVAIKILSNALEEADASFAERFKNEAKAMGKLSHPGIVAVHDFGETAGGLLYIVMEYVEGTDVARMIAKEGRLHTDHAMAITAHVCDALGYAHERGIIHRDIKPANIMVGYDGVVKVADFGLAKMTQSPNTGLTQSGMAMGTLHYMAPEALMLGSGVDHRADIYAVGVMLYQMLTGKIPQGMFELPSLQVSGLDPRYDGIIAKALREDREKRYQSVGEMRHDLDGILTQPVVKVEENAEAAPAALPTQARPQRPGGQPYRPPQSVVHQPQPAAKSSSTGLTWLVVAVVVLGIGAYVFFGGSKIGEQSRQIVQEPNVKVTPANEATSPTETKVAAATPPPTVPMVTPAPPVETVAKADLKSVTIADRKPFRWELAFAKETYESRSNLPQPRPTPEDMSLIQSDHNNGVLRWQFADARLSQPGLKITGALLRFHISDMPAAKTDSTVFVTLDETTIGSQAGASEDTWHEMSLNADKIPRTAASFELVLQCGQNGVLVHNQKSKFPARLILIGEEPNTGMPGNAPSFDLQQLPDFRTRVANYQKARHAQLSELSGKYRKALTTARAEATKVGVLADVTALDDAITRATASADKIEKNVTSLEVKPLSELPQLSATVPQRLKDLRAIFDRETTKIETTLVASLDQSLATVQTSLVQATNLEAAKTVEDYRKQMMAAFEVLRVEPTTAPQTATPASIATSSRIDGLLGNGQWQNLLPIIDQATKDTQGTWKYESGVLKCTTSTENAFCSIATEPLETYSVRVRFAAQGNKHVAVFLPTTAGGMTFGLIKSTKDVRLIETRKNSDIRQPQNYAFSDGKEHEWLIHVSATGLESTFDGLPLFNMPNLKWKEVQQPDDYPPTKPFGLGVGVNNGTAEFHSFEILIPSAVGEKSAGSSPTTPTSQGSNSPASATKDKPFENSLGMKFAPIRITGGPTDGKTLLFSVWETRVKDYEIFAKKEERPWPKPSFAQGPDHPAVQVSHDDAVAFCSWLTEKEHAEGLIKSGQEYRLPTDHEWSCLAGIGQDENPSVSPQGKDDPANLSDMPWGPTSEPPIGFANYRGTGRDSHPHTAPVGSYPAADGGFHDVWGNAGEWCFDWYHTNDQITRVIRGCGWDNWGPYRARHRRGPHMGNPLKSGRSEAVGFRVVLELPKP